MDEWANASLHTWWVVSGDKFSNELARVVDEDPLTFQLLPLPPGSPSTVTAGEITDATQMAIVDIASTVRETRAQTLLVDARRICEDMVRTAASATSETFLKDEPGHEWLTGLVDELEPFATAVTELGRKADGQV